MGVLCPHVQHNAEQSECRRLFSLQHDDEFSNLCKLRPGIQIGNIYGASHNWDYRQLFVCLSGRALIQDPRAAVPPAQTIKSQSVSRKGCPQGLVKPHPFRSRPSHSHIRTYPPRHFADRFGKILSELRSSRAKLRSTIHESRSMITVHDHGSGLGFRSLDG